MLFIKQLARECTNSHLFNIQISLDSKKYAIIILAAGSSSRLGLPKQLISWNQSNLLNNTIQQACLLDDADVFVTLGDKYKVIADTIPHDISTFHHPNWQEGMGSTIAFSVKQIVDNNYDGVILSVCDQPYISKNIFEKLISTFEKGDKSIVISEYKTASGPPTFFSSIHFKELLKLSGDNGAKVIIRKNATNVGNINFNNGDIDIDTENDVNRMNRQ